MCDVGVDVDVGVVVAVSAEDQESLEADSDWQFVTLGDQVTRVQSTTGSVGQKKL